MNGIIAFLFTIILVYCKVINLSLVITSIYLNVYSVKYF